MKRVYSNKNITVYWDSDKCIRSGKCDGMLPQVFDPAKRPWVNIDAADAETIKRVIDCCPTGALSYELPENEKSRVIIKVIKDGPHRVSGPCCLTREDGEVIPTEGVFALCRCGCSQNMPFCDGSHYSAGFRDKEEGSSEK